MEKDFDKWNLEKKRLHSTGLKKSAHQRDVWWCVLGLNLGSEEDGKEPHFVRPILVIKVFSRDICLVAPLTTSKAVHKFRIHIGFVNNKSSKILLNQIRVIDTVRLISFVDKLPKEVFECLRKTIKDML